jgi:hypothetical protein
MKEAKLDENIEVFRSEKRKSIDIDEHADLVYNFYTMIDDELNMEAEIGIKKYEVK